MRGNGGRPATAPPHDHGRRRFAADSVAYATNAPLLEAVLAPFHRKRPIDLLRTGYTAATRPPEQPWRRGTDQNGARMYFFARP